MAKKLVLVNPVNPKCTGLAVNRNFRFPPIGLGIIAALTPLMVYLNKQLYAWPMLVRKATSTFWHTRDKITTMFAWNSNIN